MGSLKLFGAKIQTERWISSPTVSEMPSSAGVTPSIISLKPASSKETQLANESMDSGIAGLRDVPHGGSPTSGASNSSSNTNLSGHHRQSPATTGQQQQQHHQQQQQQQPLQQQQQLPQQVQQQLQQRHNDADKREVGELPQYIVDRSTRTTYLKGRFLGKGGFARVHELTDLTTGHVYAGKIIPKSRITKPHHREKIAREIELHRNLVHTHVVRFFHCFEDDDNVYIVLENCSRKSLVHVMKHRKTLTEPEVRFYLRQLADGLRYVHAARVVHRDLKLGNMFLSENMTVKIGDFGLAARMDSESKVTICGTPNYIAPEVLSRQGHGYEADLWAMGCIMYAMLVGQPPFETESLSETYTRIAHNMYVIPQWISRSARSLIRQLLAPDPRHRPTLDQVLKHEFFTAGFMPSILPASCCSKAPSFAATATATNDSGIKLDSDSTNENASPVSGTHLRVPGNQVTNRSRPESVKVQVESSVKDRIARSHSLKETQSRKEREKAKEAAAAAAAVAVAAASASPKAGSVSTSLKQKITNVLCLPDRERDHEIKHCAASASTAGSGGSTSRRHPQPAPSLYSALDSCLYLAPQASSNPAAVSSSPLFISKWIDYSNKYGFGFQLSDRAVGVLFNDSTRISFSGDRSRLDFQDAGEKTSSFSINAVPSYLSERLTLLRYFAQYMDENLTEGGDSQPAGLLAPTRRSSGPFVHMKRWVRTPKAIIMQLDNSTLQINFFKDHTKIVLSADAPTGQYLVTYINSERLSSTYRLADVSHAGCEPILRERLVYALTVLREFAELDGDKV